MNRAGNVPDPATCILCASLTGPGCPHHPRPASRIPRRLAALAAAVALAAGLSACGPTPGSPNCPPGQWWVEKPGSGWECASGSSTIYTPSSFQPSPGGGQ